jgi:hypothetical protein
MNKGNIITILIVALLVLGGVWYIESNNISKNSFQVAEQNYDSGVDDQPEIMEEEQGVNDVQPVNDVFVEEPTTNQVTIIMVPIINVNGNIEMVSHEIPYTQSVLKEVYRKLFNLRSNPQTGWHGLAFNSVSIDNRVALVNLSGSWQPSGSTISFNVRQAINAAAFQYDSVDIVQVYLNGNLFDWCIDDQSGGENGCPNMPRYWIDAE